MTEANRKIIEGIYGAFGRGDVNHILAHTADGTVWDFNVAKSSVPWHAPVRGRDGLPKFFAALGENVTMEHFEPYCFATAGRDVIARVRIAYTVRSTGKRVEQEQVHWWSLDDGGRVIALRHFEDTAAVQQAWQG